jgi:hypothetical protein
MIIVAMRSRSSGSSGVATLSESTSILQASAVNKFAFMALGFYIAISVLRA